MVGTVKNDFDADPFSVDRIAVRCVVSILIKNNCPYLSKSSVLK